MSKEIKDINSNPKPMFYACVLEGLRRIAMECGYALAVHGSCSSDLDLVAVIWRSDYKPSDYLVNRFIEELSHYSFGDESFRQLTNPERRFKNQMHYTIPIIGDWYVDLTVIEEV